MHRDIAGKRVLIIGLLPNAGHLTPVCQIGAQLRDQGAEVLVVLPEEARALVHSFHLPMQLLGPVESDAGIRALDDLAHATRFSAALYAKRRYFREYVLAKNVKGFEQFAELLARARAFRPDLILADEHRFAELYRHAASLTEAPLVLFESYGTHFLAQDRGPWRPPKGPVEKRLLASASTLGRWLHFPYDRLFARRALKQFRRNQAYARCFQQAFSSAAVPPPKELRVTMGIAPLEARHLAGEIELLQDVAFFGPAPPFASWAGSEAIRDWLHDRDGRGVVYIAFGTMVAPPRSVLQQLVTAAVERGARVLVATRSAPGGGRPPGPSRDVLWTTWAPQSAVLADASVKVFVTHAGRMSIQEGLWYGKPMLCIPRLWDQFYNAWVAERLGYGISITRDTPARAIPAAVDRLLRDPSLRARAQALSTELRSLDGDTALMKTIAQIIATPEPMQPTLHH